MTDVTAPLQQGALADLQLPESYQFVSKCKKDHEWGPNGFVNLEPQNPDGLGSARFLLVLCLHPAFSPVSPGRQNLPFFSRTGNVLN